MKRAADPVIIEQLQQQILQLQANRQHAHDQLQLGLGAMETAFPGKVFPRAAVHELISDSQEEASCTNAFISMILGKLMVHQGFCLWISARHKIFPPALKAFGIAPERIFFVDATRRKDALWTIEEALKCEGLTAVVGEVRDLTFHDSRRLQLAVEKSRVTGFIHRYQPSSINAVACVSRWKILPVASFSQDRMPGPGFPRWQVQLLKARNGRTGEWLIQWSPSGLEYIQTTDQQKYKKTA